MILPESFTLEQVKRNNLEFVLRPLAMASYVQQGDILPLGF